MDAFFQSDYFTPNVKDPLLAVAGAALLFGGYLFAHGLMKGGEK